MSEPITGASGAAAVVDEPGQDIPVDVGAIVAKYQSQLTAPDPVASEQAPTEGIATPSVTPPAAEPPAPAAEAAPEQPKAEEPTLRARQLAALARIEAEARQAKEQYEAKLRELEQTPKEPAVKPPASLDEFRELLELDPDAALASIGITDKDSVAVRLMYKALGAEAPPEVQADIEKRRTQAELAALRRKVEKQEQTSKEALQQAALAARADATDRELASFAKAVPSDFKFLAAEAAQNAKEVYDGLCTIAASQFNATGQFPSARDVAQVLEKQLEADYARLSRAINGAPPPAAQPAPAQSPPSTLETLSDADTRGRPGLGEQPSPEELADPEYWIRRATAKLTQLGYRGGT